MQMIADRFGDGWHKSIGKSFGVQRITALIGDAVTKLMTKSRLNNTPRKRETGKSDFSDIKYRNKIP